MLQDESVSLGNLDLGIAMRIAANAAALENAASHKTVQCMSVCQNPFFHGR